MFQRKQNPQQTSVRFDSRHIRLRTGESQLKNGKYVYRWTDDIGKRHAVYAPTLDLLREKEEQVAADRRDGIKASTSTITINEMFALWNQLKRGIKDSIEHYYIEKGVGDPLILLHGNGDSCEYFKGQIQAFAGR